MFDWFKTLLRHHPVLTLQSLIAIFITIGLGVLIGRIKVGKVALGTSAVMFVGLYLGHIGYSIEPNISNFYGILAY